VGCAFYEMLTGEPPQTGASPQTIVTKIEAGESIERVVEAGAIPGLLASGAARDRPI